jgi:hypothetical protein
MNRRHRLWRQDAIVRGAHVGKFKHDIYGVTNITTRQQRRSRPEAAKGVIILIGNEMSPPPSLAIAPTRRR